MPDLNHSFISARERLFDYFLDFLLRLFFEKSWIILSLKFYLLVVPGRLMESQAKTMMYMISSSAKTPIN